METIQVQRAHKWTDSGCLRRPQNADVRAHCKKQCKEDMYVVLSIATLHYIQVTRQHPVQERFINHRQLEHRVKYFVFIFSFSQNKHSEHLFTPRNFCRHISGHSYSTIGKHLETQCGSNRTKTDHLFKVPKKCNAN